MKSHGGPLPRRITDAAYATMREAIVEGHTPNFLFLHYDRERWEVRNLVLVPRFVFSMSCIEMRKPIRPTARRHGHVLCNILLGNIPPDARIPMVVDGVPATLVAVRERYARLRPLEKLEHEARGWTLDVLNVVRSLDKREFYLSDIYLRDKQLQRLHPDNLHIRDKIRQQLQRLRDLGFVEFLGGGNYRLL
jgi:type II restriction enzyme